MQMNSSSFIEGHHYTLSKNKTNMQVNQEDNIQDVCHGAERGAETSVREVKVSWLEHPDKCHGDAVAVQQCASSLTSHRGLGLEMHSNNSLTTLVCQTATPDKSSSGHEDSSSPVSTASTVPLGSSAGPKSNEPELELLKNFVILHNKPCMDDRFTENSQGSHGRNIDGKLLEAKETFQGDEPDNIVNNKPFCCSCKDSLSAESQLLRLNDITRTAEAHVVSNLFTEARKSSSFTTYQNMDTTLTSRVLESHSFVVSPKYSLDSAVTYPVFMDVGLTAPSHPQSQPSSNSVLQLMGKNLTVGNNEEFVQPQTSASNYCPTLNYLFPAFASTNNFLKQDNFCYQPTLIGSSTSPSQALSIGDAQLHRQYIIAASAGFVGFPYNNWVRIHSLEMKKCERIDSCSSPYLMNEETMIDSSPERETGFRGLVSPTSTLNPVASAFDPLLQRPVAWLPSKSPSREVPGVTNFYTIQDKTG